MHFAVSIAKKQIRIFLNGHIVHTINDSDYVFIATKENPLYI